MEMRLTVNRKGTFIGSKSALGQCGKNGQMVYGYEVQIEGKNKNLTSPDNFLVDNAVIDDYFQKEYMGDDAKPCDSCEMMSQRAVEHFQEYFKNTDQEITRIKAIIRGSDYSFIEAEWKKEEREIISGESIGTIGGVEVTVGPTPPLPEVPEMSETEMYITLAAIVERLYKKGRSVTAYIHHMDPESIPKRLYKKDEDGRYDYSVDEIATLITLFPGE